MTFDSPEPDPARPAETFDEAADALLSRWPETRLEPSLDRIRALIELLGSPQEAIPVVQLTGTNGKTSTARMIDDITRARGLRTGRFTSPHVEKMSERISLDGEPLSDEEFVEVFNEIAPYLHVVDNSEPHPISFFEATVGMAFAAFANAPVDVAVVEVGLGGTWDATNVADAEVAVITPIAVDHAKYLGDSPAAIAVEKVGIVKPQTIVVSAEQRPEVLAVIDDRVREVGATLLLAGRDFTLEHRSTAVGGQVLTLQTPRARYEDVLLPLHGAHQADNALLALVAAEATAGSEVLDDELVRESLAAATSPGRLEVVRRSPTIVLDAAHNPAGAAATVAALDDSFTFEPVIAVVGMMTDKDAAGFLEQLEPGVHHIVCTRNSTDRSMSAEALADLARPIFGQDRVSLAPRLPDAIEQAAALAEAGSAITSSISSGAVLVTGSVVTVGEARTMLGGPK